MGVASGDNLVRVWIRGRTAWTGARTGQMAREEAARLHHEYVGTEHILLGLIREGEGVAAAVLTIVTRDVEGTGRASCPRPVSFGMTFQKSGSQASQLSRSSVARALPVASRCHSTIWRSSTVHSPTR